MPLNFLHPGVLAAAAYTSEHHERLTKIKKRYDAGNRFGADRHVCPVQGDRQ